MEYFNALEVDRCSESKISILSGNSRHIGSAPINLRGVGYYRTLILRVMVCIICKATHEVLKVPLPGTAGIYYLYFLLLIT